MGNIKAFLIKLNGLEYTPLGFLVLIVLILHINNIIQIPDPIFDESYYIPAARSILQGNGSDIIGHPPLGQLLISLGILSFGDNPIGWRFFSVVFGLISLVLFYLICQQLRIPKNAALLATFILSLESLSFSLSSIAMLDVFSLTFMLASFWTYLKKWSIPSGIFVALAALAKLSGVMAMLVILLHWILTDRRGIHQILMIMAISMASLLVFLPVFDFAIWHRLINPVDRIQEMLAYTQSITFSRYAESPFGIPPSRPWDWLIHLSGMQDLAFDKKSHEWYVQGYLIISPAVWALTIPAMLFALFRALKRNIASIFIISWVSGTYLIWIPISLITDRLSYVFYFYPTIGAVCMGIALGADYIQGMDISQKYIRRIADLIAPVLLLSSIVLFIVTCPGNIWLKTTCGIFLYVAMRYYLEKMDRLSRPCSNAS